MSILLKRQLIMMSFREKNFISFFINYDVKMFFLDNVVFGIAYLINEDRFIIKPSWFQVDFIIYFWKLLVELVELVSLCSPAKAGDLSRVYPYRGWDSNPVTSKGSENGWMWVKCWMSLNHQILSHVFVLIGWKKLCPNRLHSSKEKKHRFDTDPKT